MLAQVFAIEGNLTGDNLERGQEIAAATRRLDGCEGIYLLLNSAGGGMAIALWHDQSSMEAASSKESADIKEAQDRGVAVQPTATYDTVVAL